MHRNVDLQGWKNSGHNHASKELKLFLCIFEVKLFIETSKLRVAIRIAI